ncbi:MAG: hypothetical protein K2Z81_01230 [Cyanobacteria bacterium]|nr:hypothetical protein [Cyanobacteriota bacterium]
MAQPWLSSARWDSLMIIAPAFVASFVALLFGRQFAQSDNLPLWAWVTFVLFVDVAHVYSSLFRTYLDREAFRRNRTLLLTIPAVCWTVGCLLYSVDAMIFWRTLAYVAVFHFIRQQYGFMVLYSRTEPAEFHRFRSLDAATIYSATVYPLLHWHTHMPRNFNWFVSGDFVESLPSYVSEIGLIVYGLIVLAYLFKEMLLLRTTGFFNIPKNLIVWGTALSWWVGIVAFNSDMAFTMTNVVTHGVPYMALIWLYHRNKDAAGLGTGPGANGTRGLMKSIVLAYLPAFLIFLCLLAYLEEGLWDGLVWREHLAFFAPFSHLPAISDPAMLAILVPLLSLPQATHYVLDGFIWRVKDRNSIWSA